MAFKGCPPKPARGAVEDPDRHHQGAATSCIFALVSDYCNGGSKKETDTNAAARFQASIGKQPSYWCFCPLLGKYWQQGRKTRIGAMAQSAYKETQADRFVRFERASQCRSKSFQ